MQTTPKALISLVVAFIGTATTVITIMKMTILFVHPPDYDGPHWLHYLTLATLFGSLVLSPILFALCYRLLSKKQRP